MNFIKNLIKSHRKELSKDEHDSLIVNAQNGDIAARNTLVVYHSPLVIHRSYHNVDCFQEGILGLIRAIEKFDLSKGFAFSTYASYWIIQSVSRYWNQSKALIREPVYLQDMKRRYEKLKTEDDEKNKKLLKKIAKENNVAAKDIVNRISKHTTFSTIHRDADQPEFPLPDVFDSEALFVLTDPLKVLEYIAPRKREILICRANGDTLQTISGMLGISRERVRQLEVVALRDVKTLISNVSLKGFFY